MNSPVITNPLQDLLDELQAVRCHAAAAKSLAYKGEQEAGLARSSALISTAPHGWEPVSPGYVGILDALRFSYTSMDEAAAKALKAQAHAKESYRVLSVLESSLIKVQQGLQDLAEVKPC